MAHTLAMSKTLRDAVCVALVAVLTVQGLRRFVGDRYLVPSDSMQPVLYGDPVDGDVVFVDKLARAAAQRRGDLVVVANPQAADRQLVKRVAARGDEALCWIDIRAGDVWLGENAQQLRREVKEPREAMARSVTWAVAGAPGPSEQLLDLRAAAPADAGWQLAPMARSVSDARAAFRAEAHAARHEPGSEQTLPRGTVGTRGPVDATYLDLCGARSLGGEDVAVVDCGLELRFDAWPASLLLSIDSTDAAVTFAWSPPEDRLQVWVDGEVVAEVGSVLGAPWRGAATFGRLDGRDFLLLGPAHRYVLETPRPGRVPRPRTWLHIGAVGARGASLASLRVFRDVYAYREPVTSVGEVRPWPKFVRPGHWFLLGDNAFDSRDSRQFGDVPVESFLGAPTGVLGPWSRARFLGR